MKPSSKFHLLASSFLILSLTLACAFSAAATPSLQADPNAFNTLVAQTAAAQGSDPSAVNTVIAQTAAAATPLSFGGNTAVSTAPSASDEQAIKSALAAQLGWNESQMDFTLTASDGSAAYGTVKQTGQEGGAVWFAAKDSSGKWVIVHVGQDWPLCRAIQPYNFPISYVSHCEDDSGTVVDRSAGQPAPPPSNPKAGAPTQVDAFAPNPLGPAWTGFWFAHGDCYDLDLLIAVSDASCDLRLGADNLFTPQNGALFEAAFYQNAPSLNACKSAALASATMDAAQITYVCFKTNAGKYGFLIPREIQAGGVVFDAYLFP